MIIGLLIHTSTYRDTRFMTRSSSYKVEQKNPHLQCVSVLEGKKPVSLPRSDGRLLLLTTCTISIYQGEWLTAHEICLYYKHSVHTCRLQSSLKAQMHSHTLMLMTALLQTCISIDKTHLPLVVLPKRERRGGRQKMETGRGSVTFSSL
jgi:hypothetical protein